MQIQLYPAIDLIGGQCVRLTQGDFAQQTVYPKTPAEQAEIYRRAGSSWLHVIDLDAARTNGRLTQTRQIVSIVEKTGLKVQSGGGIQSRERLLEVLDAGVERVLIGSLCVRDPDLVNAWYREFGAEKIALAVDLRPADDDGPDASPRVALHGWQETSPLQLDEILSRFPWVKHLLCTDISRDGMLLGPNLPLYSRIRKHYPQIQVQASGGIGSVEDVLALQRADIPGAVLGKALLEGRFGLEQALQALSERPDAL